MIVLKGRNVQELWARGVVLMIQEGVKASSRNGDVLVVPCPVMSVYDYPCERVLLDPSRDANPFFHLFESLWMLAGRDDAAFLNRFVKDFGKRFAEPGGHIHGAYGQRWRSAFGFDQLDTVVNRLKNNPDDRQCVIQMWDAHRTNEGYNDLEGDWRDRPCNTQIYLRVRKEERPWSNKEQFYWSVLDLTVCCRSNDIVWGAYGANAVHFSVLHEYLAGRIGVSMGKMYQLSNNYHAYVNVFEKVTAGSHLVRSNNAYDSTITGAEKLMVPMPMGWAWSAWDDDLMCFMRWAQKDGSALPKFDNDWFRLVAAPMWCAHALYRQSAFDEADRMAQSVAASDWRVAAQQWLKRRKK